VAAAAKRGITTPVAGALAGALVLLRGAAARVPAAAVVDAAGLRGAGTGSDGATPGTAVRFARVGAGALEARSGAAAPAVAGGGAAPAAAGALSGGGGSSGKVCGEGRRGTLSALNASKYRLYANVMVES